MTDTDRHNPALTAARALLGRRSDWRLTRPVLTVPRPTPGWLGGALVIATIAVSWLAFDDANGRGPVGRALFLGATAILLMAWSFLLALRLRFLEPIFGGLDRMYRVHRWAGTLAVIAMFLHIRTGFDIKGGIRGSGQTMANRAEELAGIAEIVLYVLIGISLIRWVPYRWWRLTHKLLGIPYLFACLHFYTAEKPYANGSGWGWWFGIWMFVGAAAWGIRVGIRDVLLPGRRYRITSATTTGTTTELTLTPVNGRPLGQHAGQFAFLKIRAAGMREPHPFTIASTPDDPQLRFLIKDLGDWSARLTTAADLTDLTGTTVVVEGPYGRFRPHTGTAPDLWVAGGVGITPFLAAIGTLPTGSTDAPTLAYCVRTRADALALDELHAAADDGRIRLSLHISDEGTRLDPAQLATIAGRADLRGVHVSVCGPDPLVAAVTHTARQLHAASVHTEDFDIRQGFGPDLSKPIDTWTRRQLAARTNRT